MNNNLSPIQQAMAKQMDDHVAAEMRHDVDATMETMAPNPHLYNIPTMMYAKGREDVRSFYQRLIPTGHFFPPDLEIVLVSRTVGNDQVVDENIFKFTHTTIVEWMLPNIAPTGKRVEIAMVVIFKFIDGKVAHEHIYWDQASVLVQLGLLNPKGLPVCGIEAANKMAEFI